LSIARGEKIIQHWPFKLPHSSLQFASQTLDFTIRAHVALLGGDSLLKQD
jgi:hypothetical protein